MPCSPPRCWIVRERERESDLFKRETEHLCLRPPEERERELFIEEGNRTPVAKATHARYRNVEVDDQWSGLNISPPAAEERELSLIHI